MIFCWSCNESQTKKHPNIIFILADDMGYGDVGVFNPECKIDTKHLNQLAEDGIRFTDAHAPSSVCTPTRYGIITGRYPWRTKLKSGVLTGKSKAMIPKSRSTVASILKQYDYETAFIGKWHLGWDWALKDSLEFGGDGWNATDFENIDFTKNVTNTPNDLGFDYAYGHSGSLDMAPYVYLENGRITSQPNHVTRDTSKYGWWREGPTGADFIHNDVTPNFFRRSIEYITDKAQGNNPFFLYLALPSPHTPILPTEEYIGQSNLNPYADFIVLIDDYIGKLNQAVIDAGIEENTLIIFTTDNGCSPEADFPLLANKGHHPSFHFRGHKADIFEGGHRVPFIAKWPGKIKAQRIYDQTICLTDFMATCAEIVNHPLQDDEAEDSYSLLPIFTGAVQHEAVREATVHHSINGSFAIRQGQWKLIFCAGSGGWSQPRPNNLDAIADLPQIQLYDLIKDPSETNNLHQEYPAVVRALTDVMNSYIQNGRSTQGTPQTNDEYSGSWEQVTAITDP